MSRVSRGHREPLAVEALAGENNPLVIAVPPRFEAHALDRPAERNGLGMQFHHDSEFSPLDGCLIVLMDALKVGLNLSCIQIVPAWGPMNRESPHGKVETGSNSDASMPSNRGSKAFRQPSFGTPPGRVAGRIGGTQISELWSCLPVYG